MSITQPGLRHRQEVRYGATGQTLYAWPEIDGAKVDPATGATVSIYRPGEVDTPTVSGAAASESADNQLSYTLNASSTSTWYLGEHYIAEFTISVSSVTHVIRRMFDVVRIPILHYPPLRVDDLKNAHKSIDAALTQLSITDAHQRWILPAWEACIQYVEAHGWRPALITDPEVLTPMLRARALQLLCRALQSTPGDLWARMEDIYAREYEDARASTVLHYDASDGRSSQKVRNYRQPEVLVGPDLRAHASWTQLGNIKSITRWPL